MLHLENIFKTLNEQTSNVQLDISGAIPTWLNGGFIKNGPAKFELGNEQLNHWFDGMAMLHRFQIKNGAVIYTNKYIKSKANAKNKVSSEEFATQKKYHWLESITKIIRPMPTDNTNVNIAKILGKHVALTETCQYNEFDPLTLETIGPFKFKDKIPGILTSAHPHYDIKRNEIYNYSLKIGPGASYYIYKLNYKNKSRSILAKLPIKNPSYMHSFAMTENYIILVEPPLLLNQFQFIFARKPFIENYRWLSEVGARFTVIDKNNGEIKFQTYTEAFFLFHQINAYEKNKEIFLDLPIFNNAKIINDLYLKNIARDGISTPKVYRYRINMNNKTIVSELLSDVRLELPRINYTRYHMRPYQYTYAVALQNNADFFNSLVKLNVATGKYTTWQQPFCIPSEPVFVANPASNQEDEGIILSVVSNIKNKTSFLLLLNASNFEEQATAKLPFCIPYGLHGQFYHD